MKLNFLLFLCLSSLTVLAQKMEKAQYLAEYIVKTQPGTKRLKMTCLIPKQIDNIQHIDTILYSLEPTKIYEKDGDLLAEFNIDSIQSDFTIQIFAQIDLISNDFSSKQIHNTTENLEPYLVSEKYIESNHPTLIQQALKLTGKSEIKTIQNIYKFVNRSVKYSGYNPKDIGALTALEQLHGDCTEFADLFVALCRANNIPARVIEGYKTKNITMPQHNWAEVYLSEMGWRIVDPTISSFDRIDNAYIKLTSNRNNETLNNFHYYYYNYWGESVEIKESIKTGTVK